MVLEKSYSHILKKSELYEIDQIHLNRHFSKADRCLIVLWK